MTLRLSRSLQDMLPREDQYEELARPKEKEKQETGPRSNGAKPHPTEPPTSVQLPSETESKILESAGEEPNRN